MKSGMSFEAFAGHPEVLVCRDTLYQWAKDYPEFSYAKKEGSEAGKFFLEATGIKGLHGKIPGFNVTAWIFMMKNRCGWRDRVEMQENINLNANNLTATLTLADKNKLRAAIKDATDDV
jgi:hypothetical protein